MPQGNETPRTGWGVAIAATLGLSVSYIDRQTLAAIAPAVRSALAIDHTQFGWLVGGFSMAYLLCAPAAGVVVDKLGARRGFAVAVVLWSLVAGAHAFATSFAFLFALRVLLGATEAPSFPAATQAIRRSLSASQRPVAFGLLYTGSSLGAMIAAPLAVGLEARYGFRRAFVGTAVLGSLWIPFWLFMTRGNGGHAAHVPVSHPYRETVAPTPSATSRWIDVVRTPAVLRSLVAVIGSAPLILFALNWSSQYLVERWSLARTEIGGHLMVPPLLFDAGAIGFGWIASAREKKRASKVAVQTHRDLLLVAALFGASLALAPLAPSPTLAIGLFSLSVCGGGGIYVLVTADMLSRVPADRTSSAAGMTAAAQSLAHVVASPLIGMVIDHTHGYSSVLIAIGCFVVPTTLAFAFWPGLQEGQPKR